MSESPIQKEILAQYLLGSLRFAETERLDELSITDDEFVESLRAAEYDLIDAYVADDLSDADRQRFDSHYLANTHNRDRVAFARALREWAAADAATEIVNVSKGESRPRWFAWLRPSRMAFQWAVVAAVLILFVAGVLLFQNLRLRSQLRDAQASREQLLRREQESQKQVDSQRSANANTAQEVARRQDEQQRQTPALNPGSTPSPGGRVVSFILAPPMRGAGEIRSVRVPTDTSTVRVRLEIEANHPAYRAQLLDPAQQTLWHSTSVKPLTKGERKMIELSFPASLLKSGNYVLRVSGGEEIVGNYSFQIVR